MSIFETTQENTPRPSRDRALELFTDRIDRIDLIADFARYLNSDPAPQKIIFFHGVGGNGKSLLLRYLRAHLCFRVSRTDWERLWLLSDAELVPALSSVRKRSTVPSVQLDFGARPSGENRPQDPLNALFMLKKQLADHGVRTPRFDFAAISYLRKTGADLGRLNGLFPKVELGVAAEVASAIMGIPAFSAGAAAVSLLDRQLGAIYGKWKLRHKIIADIAEQVLTAPPEPDLAMALPRYFALDLNDSLDNKVQRIVLLLTLMKHSGVRVTPSLPPSLLRRA